jgi:hypothetical protein
MALPEDEKFILRGPLSINRALREADREFFSSGENLSTIYDVSVYKFPQFLRGNKSLYKDGNMLEMKNIHGLELNHQYVTTNQSEFFDFTSCEVQKYRH